ncbi:Spc24 subunit of Ndc80-domain-containing protein [Amylocarpus encephaloides]|uniref:Kinetochore protein Spc24 n=1 Tax=Amylocarpus encephaloides TaxID=45428 RepID=A0A9P7YBG8_9HELO|nr:Spc24 subunit of Ndc80-domain-containing protein [Amylocarpus encephaloides]
MLLDEDPATLIHHTVGNFNIGPDKAAVSRINDSLSTLEQARDLRMREAESALKKLSRTLTTLHNNHSDTLASHSSTQHASSISTLDSQKFRIAKSASDLEIETERISSQLADLQARLSELELQGPEGGPETARRGLVEDEITLKLAVYRGLGIEVEKEGGEEYNKVVVRNGRKGDVHIVNLEPGKFSRHFYANYFWNTV